MSSDSSSFLLAEGKQLRKETRLDEAIEYLARAVEARMNEEGTEISGGLAEFLIEYADALLCKEETNSTAFLPSTDPIQGDSDDDGEGTIPRLDSGRLDQAVARDEEDEALTDLQLAWESFEHARLCLLAKTDDEQRRRDLSFVHCRLGDIQALQDQFTASIADYGESIEYAISASLPIRKVAGLLVSLSQTIQALMTSEEFKSDQFNETTFVEKFQPLLRLAALKYEVTEYSPKGNGAALIARDGFLLANYMLAKVQSADSGADLKSTIDELQACAEDCAHQQAELAEARQVVSGVTTSGFARPSGNESTSTVVNVAVKRKIVSGETSERQSDVATSPRMDPAMKKSKEADSENSDRERADKATLVD
jgi:hypothetical protein